MEAYIGQIKMFPYDSQEDLPGWMLCDGRELNIAHNPALFSILGNKYGGNGITTFAIPNLQGRVPVHMEHRDRIGFQDGQLAVSLTTEQIPSHSHQFGATSKPVDTRNPEQAAFGVVKEEPKYRDKKETDKADKIVILHEDTVRYTGEGMPHSNLQPYLVMGYYIATSGSYPSPDMDGINPCIGEIILFAGTTIPGNFLPCDGRSLDTVSYSSLYGVIGFTFGWDQNKFRVPDLTIRVPVGHGQSSSSQNYTLGSQGGQKDVTLRVDQLPPHTHKVQSLEKLADLADATNEAMFGIIKSRVGKPLYTKKAVVIDREFLQTIIGSSGGGKAHSNMQPYIQLSYLIAYEGRRAPSE